MDLIRNKIACLFTLGLVLFIFSGCGDSEVSVSDQANELTPGAIVQADYDGDPELETIAYQIYTCYFEKNLKLPAGIAEEPSSNPITVENEVEFTRCEENVCESLKRYQSYGNEAFSTLVVMVIEYIQEEQLQKGGAESGANSLAIFLKKANRNCPALLLNTL